jgi:hypothetical protein
LDEGTSVPLQPVKDNFVHLFRFLPEKPMTATWHHREFGPFDIVAQVFGAVVMVAGIRYGLVFTAD